MSNTLFDINQLARMRGINSYIPPAIPDDIGTFELDRNIVMILANQKLRNFQSYAYLLENGIESTRARLS